MPRKPQPRKVKIVRYELPDGTRCTKGTPGAVRHVALSDTYYASIDGKRVSLGTTELQAAWVALRDELRRRELRRQGITDDYSDHAGRPVEGHRDAWLKAVADSGTSAGQVVILSAHVTTLCRLAGWRRLADVTADGCLAALARLQRDGRSAQTRNHYLRHAKQFTRWCCDNDRLARDPLRSLRAVGVEADRRRIHRMPTDVEMASLFAYLESGEASRNKGTKGRGPAQRLADGKLRALVYKVSMATGLRENETRNLTREGFDLTSGTASATCRASYSKNRREARQPLPTWLADELRAWFDSGGEWPRVPGKGGEMLQADLAAAGVQYETAEGIFSWHSLRVFYITKLANQPGMDPKTLFDLARHSDPKLTLKTYSRGTDEARRKAVEEITKPGTGQPATNSPAEGDPAPRAEQ